MAIAINKRTLIYAGVGVVVIAAAAGWFLFLRDDGSPEPQAKKGPAPVAKAPAPVAKAPEAPKPPAAPDATKTAEAPKPPAPAADAAKGAAPEPAAQKVADAAPKPEAKAEPKPEAKPEPKVEAPAPVAAATEHRKAAFNPKRKEDARHCLDQASNNAITKCAEEYL